MPNFEDVLANIAMKIFILVGDECLLIFRLSQHFFPIKGKNTSFRRIQK